MKLILPLIVLFATASFYLITLVNYNSTVTAVNTDFSKNYWLHPRNPVLSGSYVENTFVGGIQTARYQDQGLEIIVSNGQEERSFIIPELLVSEYLEGSQETGRVSIVEANYNDGNKEILDISFITNEN